MPTYLPDPATADVHNRYVIKLMRALLAAELPGPSPADPAGTSRWSKPASGKMFRSGPSSSPRRRRLTRFFLSTLRVGAGRQDALGDRAQRPQQRPARGRHGRCRRGLQIRRFPAGRPRLDRIPLHHSGASRSRTQDGSLGRGGSRRGRLGRPRVRASPPEELLELLPLHPEAGERQAEDLVLRGCPASSGEERLPPPQRLIVRAKHERREGIGFAAGSARALAAIPAQLQGGSSACPRARRAHHLLDLVTRPSTSSCQRGGRRDGLAVS